MNEPPTLSVDLCHTVSEWTYSGHFTVVIHTSSEHTIHCTYGTTTAPQHTHANEAGATPPPPAHPPTRQNLDANFLSVYAITRFYTIGQTVYHHNPKCGTVAHTIQPNSVSGCTTVPTQTHQPATQPRNRSIYLQLRITLKRNSGCSTKPFNHN